MKKIFSLMAAACAVVAFASCEKDNGGENTDNGEGSGSDTEYAAPTITWEGHDDFTAELESEMDVKIQITAEAGIKSFIVGVDSDVLDPIISVVNSGSTDMDLINGPETLLAFLSSESIGLPTGENLTGQTNLTLDLSNLVPLIIDMGNQQGTLNPDSDHIFTLSLTDNADRPLSQKVTFHYTGTTSQEPITMTWEGNPNFDEVELTSDLTVKINIAAAAGISSFVVKVDSENETFMEIIKNITSQAEAPDYELDLINNETICSALESLTSNALPTGSELKDQTSVEFDLTNLVSYITLISKTLGEKHNFILNMEDNDGNKFSKICTFVTPASSN